MQANTKPKKRIPERQCVGCGEGKPKPELLRVVRGPEGDVSLDFTGKKSGRGAYLCHSVKCLQRVRKSGRLSHSLGVEIPAEVWEQMQRELEEYEATAEQP